MLSNINIKSLWILVCFVFYDLAIFVISTWLNLVGHGWKKTPHKKKTLQSHKEAEK